VQIVDASQENANAVVHRKGAKVVPGQSAVVGQYCINNMCFVIGK